MTTNLHGPFACSFSVVPSMKSTAYINPPRAMLQITAGITRPKQPSAEVVRTSSRLRRIDSTTIGPSSPARLKRTQGERAHDLEEQPSDQEYVP